MSVLTLRLAGPLQSWGGSSRFTRRATETLPTKSGLIGLIAAAQGRRRSDPIEDLLGLKLAVRSEQQGSLLRDFHTAHHLVKGTSMPLTDRFYWSDAVFTAHIGAPRPLLEGLAEALRDPAYPLYLGRRSCVPEGRMVLGIDDHTVADSVRSLPWSPGVSGKDGARRRRESSVRLAVQADVSVYAPEGVEATRELNDVPLSFDPERREYRSRLVVDTFVVVSTGFEWNASGAASAPSHDPMAVLGGAG